MTPARRSATVGGLRHLRIARPVERRCALAIGAGALRSLDQLWRKGWDEAALIGDRQVLDLHGEAVRQRLQPLVRRVITLGFEPGEASKSRATKAALEDQLFSEGFGRQGCIVALGGGVSLDLAGFVAATYLRGVDYVNLPTSLLAQVDAAIGGKTAINAPRGKNLIGAFHQPSAVLVDSELLATLPAPEWPNGLAELVKHGVIADAELLRWIESHAAELGTAGRIDPHPLQRSLEIKADIVRADEREAGLRAVLNFGHTIGHAIERASDYQVGHGMAVALGICVEAAVAVDRCGFPSADWERLLQLWPELGWTDWPSVALDELWPHLAVDKKRRQQQVHMALPSAVGQMAIGDGCYTVAVTEAELRTAWRRWQRRRR